MVFHLKKLNAIIMMWIKPQSDTNTEASNPLRKSLPLTCHIPLYYVYRIRIWHSMIEKLRECGKSKAYKYMKRKTHRNWTKFASYIFSYSFHPCYPLFIEWTFVKVVRLCHVKGTRKRNSISEIIDEKTYSIFIRLFSFPLWENTFHFAVVTCTIFHRLPLLLQQLHIICW